MSDLISKLEWRYATKKFDPSQVVSQDKIDFILEAIRLSATSSGLQPYEVLVITPDNKAETGYQYQVRLCGSVGYSAPSSPPPQL